MGAKVQSKPLHDHQKLSRFAEAVFRAADSPHVRERRAWPTVARAARALRWTQRRVEEACNGDPDGNLMLTGYNLCDEREGEPVLGQLYVELMHPLEESS